MSALTTLALSPFALIFRASYARPWLAVIVSAAAGLIAHLLGHDVWAVLFASFMSYMMIWIDETRNPRATEQLPEE